MSIWKIKEKEKTQMKSEQSVERVHTDILEKDKGITLVALVVTIIVLIILATISVNIIFGEQGILERVGQAQQETQIATYKERIELIRGELIIDKEGKLPTIHQMQERLDSSKEREWVASTEIKVVEDGIEKLVLTTKEGYIFYITETEAEYKGKGKVENTSDLKRDDVIRIEIVGTGENGEIVKITNLSEFDYYKIEYKINSTEGEWTEIESGATVEVEYNSIVNARLVYETSKGIIHSLAIGELEPTVVAKDIDTSDVERKTDIAIANLFDITWGSEGIGETEYTVTGKLKFQDTEYSGEEIDNISKLEVGTYQVTCKITSPSNKSITAEKEVNVLKLARTVVEDENNNNQEEEAKAIYSEYDLAYFRDLVNLEGQNTINGKLMNPIDLSKVCSDKIESWTPIGAAEEDWASWVEYKGIFDGDNYTISNIYISSTKPGLGLFGITSYKGTVKNLTVDGYVENTDTQNENNLEIAGIVAAYWR